MAEIQTITAAFSIAELALKTGRLIHKVIQARTDADALHHETRHVRSLAERIGRFLEYRREKHGPLTNSIALDTVKAIRECLEECKVCFKILEQELAPFADPGTGDRPAGYGKRLRFVCSAAWIGKQQTLIKTLTDTLTIDLILLQNLDQTTTLERLQQLSNDLVNTAQSQRSDVDQIPRPDSDEDVPTSQNVQSDASEDELDLAQGCAECRRRNRIVPDDELTIAVKHRKPVSVQALIKDATRKQITVKDPDDWTLLHYATHLSDHASTSYILSRPEAHEPEFLNATTKAGQTALMHVVAQPDATDSYAIAEELIQHGCDVKFQDSSEEKRTALWWAVDGSHSEGRKQMISLLLRSGALALLVRDGKLKDKAMQYPEIEEAAKLEERAAQQQQTRDEGEHDSLGRRLTNVIADATR